MKKITHAGEIDLAGYILPCYVTKDEERIISSRRLQAALKMVDEKKGQQSPGKRLDRFFNYRALKPLFNEGFPQGHFKAITSKYGGQTIKGYKAEVLVDICNIMLKARRMSLLSGARQKIVAKQCEILLGAFAQVGIIALIDEATGYQNIRARKALEEILNKFISEELRKWAKTFPDEFYKQMFKLRGWPYDPASMKKPSVVGHYTNDLIYDRLAPGVLEELKKNNPRTPKGYRKNKHFQWLTEDVGDPRLREHLSAVIALMKASTTWDSFYRLLQRALPRYGDNYELPFKEDS